MTKTVTLSFPNGARIEAPARWRGRALAVHLPIDRDGNPTASRGLWIITGTVHGLSAGSFSGPLRDAIRLARVWDDAFAAALPEWRSTAPSLANWPHTQQWVRQLQRLDPPTGPGLPNEIRERARVRAADDDGGEQFPATPTMTPAGPGRVRFARRLNNGRERLRDPETGKALQMDGDIAAFKGPDPLTPVLRLRWRGAWVDVPTIAECMAWSFDSIAETPDGSRVEPDAPDSWLSLLGIV